MVKDVTNSLTEIKVDFQPAVINVDREAIEAQVAAAIAQYSGREVTVDNYKEVYEERTRFNKLIGGLDTQRKDFNRQINEPAKDFDKWVKEKVIKPIEAVTDAMSAGLNAIDEHERLMRVDVVRATFEDKCMVAGIEKSTFADKYDEYSLKKYFKTGKYELKKTTLDEMDGLVLSEFDALEEYKANKQAQEYDLPADSYIRHLEDGKSLVDILKMMKTDRDAEIARKEQKEIQEKAKAERLEEIAQSAKKNANANIKAYDAETGEILEQGTITPEPQNNAREVAKFEPSEPLVKLVRLELHGGLEQWENTQEYFEDNFIGFETLED
ncbi:phage protein [Streptococcus pneumoniae]|nr:phage protein [Streptococcus pneumoniae]